MHVVCQLADSIGPAFCWIGMGGPLAGMLTAYSPASLVCRLRRWSPNHGLRATQARGRRQQRWRPHCLFQHRWQQCFCSCCNAAARRSGCPLAAVLCPTAGEGRRATAAAAVHCRCCGRCPGRWRRGWRATAGAISRQPTPLAGNINPNTYISKQWFSSRHAYACTLDACMQRMPHLHCSLAPYSGHC